MRRHYYITLLLTSMLIFIFFFIRILEGYFPFNSLLFQNIFWALSGAFIVFYLTYIVRTFTINPMPYKISIIGQPHSGKTVYLTVLFDKLTTYKNANINFFPYGSETIEQIATDLKQLYSGKWPKPTSKESLFIYRAIATYGRGLFKRKYTIEIADYAGEYIKEFDSSSELWLHKTDYFKHVISSDAVLMAVDIELIMNGNDYEFQEMQNKLIAAFQVMVNEKGVSADKKLQIPVALLIMKIDLWEINKLKEKYVAEVIIEEHLNRLINLCRTKCYNFEIFYVSSVGKIKQDGAPPDGLDFKPLNVCEPMVWILKHRNL